MRCQQAKKHLVHYLAGESPDFDTAALEKHLQECSGCRAELAAMEELGQLLDVLDDAEVPAGFSARVLEALERPASGSAGGKTAGWRFRLTASLCGDLVAAAAVALLVFWAGGAWFTPRCDQFNDRISQAAYSYVQFSSQVLEKAVISTGNLAVEFFEKEQR